MPSPKPADPVTVAEAAAQAATAELQAAESALTALRERETAAGLAADNARLACETAESARADAIRAAITAGTDPAAAARASQAERLLLTAEADDLAAVRDATAEAVIDAEARVTAAREAVTEARNLLRHATAAALRTQALQAARTVRAAWAAHCAAFGLGDQHGFELWFRELKA